VGKCKKGCCSRAAERGGMKCARPTPATIMVLLWPKESRAEKGVCLRFYESRPGSVCDKQPPNFRERY
jgi:hypothetical protein